MADTATTEYIVAVAKLPIVTGVNPRTGVDRVGEARFGDRVQLTDEQLGKKLEKGYVRLPDADAELSDEEQAAAAARDQEEQQEAERLTEKQQLQKRATELKLPFEEKTTSNQLKAMIAEREEQNRDQSQPQDGTGTQDAG